MAELDELRQMYAVSSMHAGEYDPDMERVLVDDIDKADVWGSLGPDGKHRPTLDIDLPCRLTDSETPGHHHLFIDHPMSWEQYEKVLHALADAGIIEEGYADASIARQNSYVAIRPWKGSKPEPEPEEKF